MPAPIIALGVAAAKSGILGSVGGFIGSIFGGGSSGDGIDRAKISLNDIVENENDIAVIFGNHDPKIQQQAGLLYRRNSMSDVGSQWNDMIPYIAVNKNFKVTIYEHPNFQGANETIYGNQPSHGANGSYFGDPGGEFFLAQYGRDFWNDRISSFKVEKIGSGNGWTIQTVPSAVTNGNTGGNTNINNGTGNSNPITWNNPIPINSGGTTQKPSNLLPTVNITGSSPRKSVETGLIVLSFLAILLVFGKKLKSLFKF